MRILRLGKRGRTEGGGEDMSEADAISNNQTHKNQ